MKIFDRELEVKKFSFFSFEDIADFHFQHEFCRSRMYEYPFALQEIANLYIESPVIHNASWGFQDINLVFKTWLDIKYPNTFHSDIKKSTLFQTFLWDITSFPQESMHDRFDVILNISTLEECNADHSIVLKNHLIHLKKRGRLIITFAHPGLQLDSIGKFIDSKIVTPQLKLNPRNSRQEDRKLGLPDEFSVGCLVIDRIK